MVGGGGEGVGGCVTGGRDGEGGEGGEDLSEGGGAGEGGAEAELWGWLWVFGGSYFI